MARRKITAGASTMTVDEALDLSYQIAEAAIGDPSLREALSGGELALRLEDRGWTDLSRVGGDSSELLAQDRAKVVALCRLHWRHDPLCRQAVRLWTDYALGGGLTYQIADAKAQVALDAMWKHPRNRPTLGTQGQRRSSRRLLVDSDVFLAAFEADTAPLVVRLLETLEITAILTDPEDADRVLYYRRDWAVNGKPRVSYYRDWTLFDEEEPVPSAVDPVTNHEVTATNKQIVTGAWVRHVAFEPLRHRGTPLLEPVLDWAREHRNFMRARVAIVRALAKFAWLATVEGAGGAAEKKIQAIKKRIESTLAATNVERNPSPTPGATGLQSTGVKLEPSARVTGGREARDDGDMLKLMFTAGTGFPLHYYGDASDANLATATAMELPVLKATQAYQDLWTEAYRDLSELALRVAEVKTIKNVDIDWPPIIFDDLGQLSVLTQALATADPALVALPEYRQKLLLAMRINNVAEILRRLKRGEARPTAAVTPGDEEQALERLAEAASGVRVLLEKRIREAL